MNVLSALVPACLPRCSCDKVGRAHSQDSRLVALNASWRCAAVPHTRPAPAARQRSVDPPHPLPGRCLVMPRDFAATAPFGHRRSATFSRTARTLATARCDAPRRRAYAYYGAFQIPPSWHPAERPRNLVMAYAQPMTDCPDRSSCLAEMMQIHEQAPHVEDRFEKAALLVQHEQRRNCSIPAYARSASATTRCSFAHDLWRTLLRRVLGHPWLLTQHICDTGHKQRTLSGW